MFKRLIAKGNLHRTDHFRALVTDTSPGDIPIIISNDGFYRNCKAPSPASSHQAEFVERLLDPPRSYTVPYRYNILRAGTKTRRISLIHPSAQIAVCEFYRDLGHLICYFCRKSPASIRSPRKVGSTFFVRGTASESNRLKGEKVDTVDLEHSIANPASYFAYGGHNRAFRFFESADYLRLEKRYSIMHFADITKCFSSIYTHTLFWATADIQTAKDNTQAITFSNRFDRLMQSMNFNETNGICIGAEISRVFAEVLLSEVDAQIVIYLAARDCHHRQDFEFRRYVDDYYVFSKDAAVAEKVLSAISACLSRFNMHLNGEKTLGVARPFITVKSRLIRDANRSLEEFFAKFIRMGSSSDASYSYPKRVRRAGALLRSLLDSIKGTSFDHQAGYNLTSNYIIGALSTRISALISDYEKGIAHENVTEDDYVDCLLLLLEAVYFFYNVDPTVPSSLRVSQAAIQCAEFFKNRLPSRISFLAEQIVRWTFQLIRGLKGSTVHRDSSCVPLEALNVLLVLGEVGREDALAQQTVSEFCGTFELLEYFEIVSFLFCMGSHTSFAALRDSLFERACGLLSSGLGVRTDAHSAHLALDLLSCPHITRAKRASLFNDLRRQMELSQVSSAHAGTAVDAFEANPWFVDWKNTNLLRMIRKKELSDVY